jgi:diguanylate cyclase (GGDEF)-like protein/PAS domain S-box-containing protein
MLVRFAGKHQWSQEKAGQRNTMSAGAQSDAEAAIAEACRLDALRRFEVLDTPAETGFDDLTTLAAQLCETPIALVSLVDSDRQWHKSMVGVEVDTAPRELSICAHALHNDGLLLVPDLLLDPRFVDNPMVAKLGVRFYAGAPLRTDDGFVLGTLCVLDTVPRLLSARQREQLEMLAGQVMAQLELRRNIAALATEVQARRKTELELAQSHLVMVGMLAASQSMVSVKDLDGKFLIANPKLHEVLGVPDGDLLGHTDWDFLNRDLAANYQRQDQAVLATNKPTTWQHEVELADGSTRHFQSVKFPVRDPGGAVYAIGNFATDVTDLAQTRQDLAESVQRWQSLVEWSQTGVIVIGRDATFRYLNPAAERLHRGTGSGELLGLPVSDFRVANAEEPDSQTVFENLLAGAVMLDQPGQLRQLDGNIINIEANAIAVQYDGEPCIQIEMWDNTSRDAAASALRESESRSRALLSASPVGIFLRDEHGLFVSVNDAMCTLTGRRQDELIGQTSAFLTHPDDLHLRAVADKIIDSAEDGIARLEKRYVRPDGSIRWVWLTLTHLPGPQGQVWTLAHAQDITDRHAHERAIATSEANLRAVSRVVHRIQSGADARQTIVDAGRQLAEADLVSLFELDTAGGALMISAATEISLLETRIPLSAVSAAVQVFRTGRPLLLSDPAGHPLVLPHMMHLTGAQSVYLAPVGFGGVTTAVLLLVWRCRVPDMAQRHTEVVALLADHAGVALRQAAMVAELENLALTDPLTGLPNRRSWNQRLAALLVTARRRRQRLTVALADLDHFKEFNDTFGHPAGDNLLCQFAAAADLALRADDTVARWGGEEFALALPDCSEPEAVGVLDRVRSSVPHRQTCSIGYATWNGVESAEQLMQRADRALYAAKHAGRDRVLSA